MGDVYRFVSGHMERVDQEVIQEIPLSIIANGQELATLMCTPDKLECLVLGFLYLEDIIQGLEEVHHWRICEKDGLARVYLKKEMPHQGRRIYTSGCGRGISFASALEGHSVIEIPCPVSPSQIQGLMRELHERAELYRTYGGVHASGLSDGARIIVLAEDIGRHNTLDKIQGECLLRNISPQRKILLTTGRISSEMIRKAARMQVPVVVSLTSPTSLAVELAEAAGITIIGYAKGKSFNIYSHPSRLLGEEGRREKALPGESLRQPYLSPLAGM